VDYNSTNSDCVVTGCSPLDTAAGGGTDCADVRLDQDDVLFMELRQELERRFPDTGDVRAEVKGNVGAAMPNHSRWFNYNLPNIVA